MKKSKSIHFETLFPTHFSLTLDAVRIPGSTLGTLLPLVDEGVKLLVLIF